ncbi:MAG: FlgD immunoglobulin-like domain containing protein, partial [candidate division WOR-3 bacterium]
IDRDATDLVGMLIPDGYITLVGVIGQYAPNPPHFGGYQLMPRMLSDLGVPQRPLLTIRKVQEPGPDGVTPRLLDSIVRVRGRITGPARVFTTGSSKSLYIQDSTQGINIYGCRFSTSQERFLESLGVEWEVVARVSEYNGLTELVEGTMWVSDTVRDYVQPRLLPFNTGLSEGMESNLLMVVGDVISGPVRSGSGYNVVIKNGTPAINIRIGDNTGIPVTGIVAGHKVRFIGICGQYDYEAPYTTGYQLLPRFAEDVRDTTSPVGPTERLVLDSITPNPFVPGEGQVATIQVNSPRSGYRLTVAIYDLEGRLVKELLANGPGGYYDLKWDGTDGIGRPKAAGIYLVSVKASTGDGRTETITRPVVLGVRLRLR